MYEFKEQLYKFRLRLYTSLSSIIIIYLDKADSENYLYSLQQSVPYGEGISPLHISDEEELERLAGLQLRDSLVRGLGVGEQIQVSLDQLSTSRPPSTLIPSSSTTQSANPPPMFFTHVVHRDRSDSGVGVSHSSSSLPSENNILSSVTNSVDSSPLHSLPGAGPRAVGRGSHATTTHHLLRPTRRSHSHSSGCGQQPAPVNSLSAAYHRPTYAFGSTVK